VNLAIIHSVTPTICLVHALTGVRSNCDLFEAGCCNVPVIAGSAQRNDRLYERRHAAGVVSRQHACNDRQRDRQVIDLCCIVVADDTQNNNSPNCKCPMD